MRRLDGKSFADRRHIAAGDHLDAAVATFSEKQIENRARRPVAEQLPERLLVIRDPITLDERDEVGRLIPRKRRSDEGWIAREEMLRPGVDVGEIAPAAARNQDLAARLAIALDHHDLAPALTRDGGAEEPGGARAENDGVVLH